jgi:hypothetical protein
MPQSTINIVTRMGEDGLYNLKELSLCLQAQSDTNFTWIIILRPGAHKYATSLRKDFSSNSAMVGKVKIIKAKTDNRAKLLNLALSRIKLGYVNVLDDDDIPLFNYVETIRKNIVLSSGSKIVRTQVVLQESMEIRDSKGDIGKVAVAKLARKWPEEFDILDHAHYNSSPCMSLSFPVHKLKEKNIKWDDQLVVVEDWDFLMSALRFMDVQNDQTVTAIYRKNQNGFRSQNQIKKSTWIRDENTVREKINKYTYRIEIKNIGKKVKQSLNINSKNLPKRAIFVLKATKILFPHLSKHALTYNMGRSIFKVTCYLLRIQKHVKS